MENNLAASEEITLDCINRQNMVDHPSFILCIIICHCSPPQWFQNSFLDKGIERRRVVIGDRVWNICGNLSTEDVQNYIQ